MRNSIKYKSHKKITKTIITLTAVAALYTGLYCCEILQAADTNQSQSAEPDKSINAKTEPVISNQSYYTNPPNEYAKKRCKLDVYLPANADEKEKIGDKKFPVIVFFHGGGLSRGHRRVMMPLVKALLAENIGVAMADYRLAPKADVPDFIKDAAAATSWVLDNADSIGADKNKIFCGGYSAGAYLAAMVVQDKSYMEKFGQRVENLAGLIAISGQMVTHRQVRTLMGLDSKKSVINKYAPLNHANAKSIPTLCIVGDNDNPARLEENLYWMKVRQLAGNESDQMIVQKNRTHGNIVNRSDSPEEATNKAMVDFIKATTKPATKTLPVKP